MRPGPFNDTSLTFKVPADFKSRSGLGFIHMNVRSLLPKLDLVRIWAKNTSADVIVISGVCDMGYQHLLFLY